jgi:hypothetical protein
VGKSFLLFDLGHVLIDLYSDDFIEIISHCYFTLLNHRKKGPV